MTDPIQAFYDADPAGWRPYYYTGHADLGVAVDSLATIVIQTNFAPYIWTEVAHTIVGDIDDPESSGLKNDGQYLVSVSDNRSNYISSPTPANNAFGPHKEGQFAPLPIPQFYPSNTGISIQLQNLYTRVLTPVSETFRVYFTLRGLSYWGDLKVPQNLMDMSRGA